MRPIHTPSRPRRARIAPRPPARIEPRAGEIGRESQRAATLSGRRRPSGSRGAAARVVQRDERERQRGPGEPQRQPPSAQREAAAASGAARVRARRACDVADHASNATRRRRLARGRQAHSQTQASRARPVGNVDEVVLISGQHGQPRSATNQTCEQDARQAGQLGARTASHRITASAMCSDGTWLKGGRSPSARRTAPADAVRGRAARTRSAAETRRSRRRRRAAPSAAAAMRVELAARRADEQRQAVEQRRSTSRARSSRPRTGSARSHSNTSAGTSARSDASQLARPYVSKKNGARNAATQRAPPRPLLGRDARRCAHAPVRAASETVKMPHSSMRCVDLAEARGLDQLVHLRLRAPAHHPGPPPRWLVSARAMSSSCGCQGWPV